MRTVEIAGKPEHKGSWRVAKTGQLYSDNPRLAGWARHVAATYAAASNGAGVLEGPVVVIAEFRFARPPSHFTTTGALRKGAARTPGRPDLDKLLRGLLDALTGVAFRDDAQVSDIDACKVYADSAGVLLHVGPLGEG